MSRQRVPPPPPPGFGDDEYYRLYARPEDYHKYRAKLELEVRQQREQGEIDYEYDPLEKTDNKQSQYHQFDNLDPRDARRRIGRRIRYGSRLV